MSSTTVLIGSGVRAELPGRVAALGANRGRLVRSVLREGLAMTSAGLVLGGVIAMALSQLIAHLLFEVEPTDATTFAGVAALLLAIATFASWLRHRRH